MNGTTHRIARIYVSPGSEYPKAGQATLFAVAYDANQPDLQLAMQISAFDESGHPIPNAAIRVEVISDKTDHSVGNYETYQITAGNESAEFKIPQACMEELFSFALSVHARAPFDETESVAVVVRFAPIGIPIVDDDEEVTDPMNVDPARILQEFGEQLKQVATLSDAIQPLLDKVTGLPKDVLAIKRHLAQIQKQADGFSKLPEAVATLLAKPITDAINLVTSEMAALRTAIQGTVQTEVASAFTAQTTALEAVIRGLPANAKAGSGTQTNTDETKCLTKGRKIKRTIIVLVVLVVVIWMIVKFA